MINKILLSFLLSVASLNLSAQCLTDHYQKEILKQHPNVALEMNQFFDNLSQFSSQKRATKYIIPVVFHVIHTNGPENISLEQIEDQIRILNEDFSLTNPNKSSIRSQFTNVAADCEFEFRLAKIDPDGKCTNGVNRVFSPLHVEARDNVKSITGARWNNRNYLNIWVVSSIKNQDQTSQGITLGYAYLPYSIIPGNIHHLDGIVCRSDYIGTIGTGSSTGAGRTLTHEVGHYLGLLHPFEDGCSGTGSNNGDRCADTPPVDGTFTNANCPSNGNSCSTDVPDIIDQWENYMDYSRGTCQSMFTNNQKSIMHNVMETYTSIRKNLTTNANHILTGLAFGQSAPIAYFKSSTRVVCVGDPVTFSDISCKAEVTSRQWTFEGANIISTNIENPIVTYNNPGFYKVTLMASNTNGNSTTTEDKYIRVLPKTAIDKPTVRQEFATENWDIGSGWSVLDEGTIKFKRDESTGFSGIGCLVAPITSSTPIGQRFQLTSIPVDLRPIKNQNPKISMMLGYRRRASNSSEGIRLYYSIGCNNNWTQFLYRNALFMSSEPNTYINDFKPSQNSHWKLLSTSLAQFENDSNISFMVEIESGSGNPVYIDDINIGIYNTNISDIENNIQVNIYPNPTENILNISYLNKIGTSEVWIENIEGKKIDQILELTPKNGEINIKYHRNPTITSGIYIVKIRVNEQIINKKVIFAN
ncbi:MAG: M43 family zinc metalloprotease [Bacteroidota bacterium]|nr:M43 family zinc metalloprotease [Bacteroidota bacterium]